MQQAIDFTTSPQANPLKAIIHSEHPQSFLGEIYSWFAVSMQFSQKSQENSENIWTCISVCIFKIPGSHVNYVRSNKIVKFLTEKI